MGGSPCWEFGFEAQKPIIEELRLKQLCEPRAASFPVALSISVGSESHLGLQPCLPRLESQGVGAVSALKTMGQKPGAGGIRRGFPGCSWWGWQELCRTTPHWRELSSPGWNQAWGAGQPNSHWVLLQEAMGDPAGILGRTLQVFPPPWGVSAAQGSVCSWEASPRPGFSWSIPVWGVC